MESQTNLRCLIVASNKELCEDTSKWLSENETEDGFFLRDYKGYTIKAYSRWPKCPTGLPGSPASDVLIIRVTSTDDWNSIHELVYENSIIQFKIVISEVDIPEMIEDVKPIYVCKPDSSNTALLEEIIKAETELSDLLKKVFNNFDKSGDGFIDINEIEVLCRELGMDVTRSEYKETIKGLDVNKDGKISFEEFIDWWKTGRQCSNILDSLIKVKLATSSFFNSVVNSKYLESIKEKLETLKKEQRELVNSFVSINLDKVGSNPEIMISLDGYFGGETMDKLSKSYVNNFEGLKSSDFFVILEFKVKDPSKIDLLKKFLQTLTNNLNESLRHVSRKIFSYFNSDMSIMVLKKDDHILCLSIKLKRVIKDELMSFENAFKHFLDEEITQQICLSFCMQGNIDKLKENPNALFVENFDLSSSLQIKSEILKKNLKVLLKKLKNLPRFLKLCLNSYAGSHIELNFGLDQFKSANNILSQPSNVIIGFLKDNFLRILQNILSSFGGLNQYKRFFEEVESEYNLVLNSPLMHLNLKFDCQKLKDLLTL